ncbi:hypothetical protein FCM35_KLT03950 [Carex littledalei]|uniref:Uncharacterized protein n=1 Tax=Carex littledalei TaxID=544730 RepID=A0A833VA75_9POAL|nr:hypothetical protein FCM35_KLT03950 [Carex littledalei]
MERKTEKYFPVNSFSNFRLSLSVLSFCLLRFTLHLATSTFLHALLAAPLLAISAVLLLTQMRCVLPVAPCLASPRLSAVDEFTLLSLKSSPCTLLGLPQVLFSKGGNYLYTGGIKGTAYMRGTKKSEWRRLERKEGKFGKFFECAEPRRDWENATRLSEKQHDWKSEKWRGWESGMKRRNAGGERRGQRERESELGRK